jgi:hypothetical protein
VSAIESGSTIDNDPVEVPDSELAALYGVTTWRLNEQLRRNRSRFPADFLFELTAEEFANLKSHFATSSWGGHAAAASIEAA